jgi:hypothetical protein
MKAKRRVVCTVFGLLAALTAQAVPNALADMVQAPVWIERAGKRLPLAAGMELLNRDRLLTGEGGRVVIRFADTSAVRIGENSDVAVNAMQQRKNGIFAGGLDLKSGDLRLISHEYEEAPVNRAINVRFGEVTAAVRGEADLTGTSDQVKDAVALRDGKAVMSHPLASESTVLQVPLQVYQAEKGKAPGALLEIDRFDGAIWGLRTQPFYDGGTQEKTGAWMLRFGIFNKEEVLALYDRLRQAGYAARIKPLPVKGGHRYELRLMNLVTEREAHSLAERLAGNLQLPSAEVLLRR